MYKPFNPTWFALGALVCTIAFALSPSWKEWSSRKWPKWMEGAFIATILMQIFLCFFIHNYNEIRMCDEVQDLQISEIVSVTVSKGKAVQVIEDPAAIKEFFAEIKK